MFYGNRAAVGSGSGQLKMLKRKSQVRVLSVAKYLKISIRLIT